jgi:hypothetical protein
MIILAGGATVLSWNQAHESSVSIFDCTSHATIAPTSFVLSCADANSELSGLHWAGWGLSTAYATGTARWNDCTPNCAGGTWKSESISVYAYRIKNGHYTRLDARNSAVFAGGAFVAESCPPAK